MLLRSLRTAAAVGSRSLSSRPFFFCASVLVVHGKPSPPTRISSATRYTVQPRGCFFSSSAGASSSSSSPQSYMRQLLLRIHPDLLMDPEHQVANAQALAVLNSILDARADKGDDARAYKDIRAQKLLFHYHCQDKQAMTTAHVEWKGVHAKERHPRILVDRFLVKLLHAAGVVLSEKHLKEWEFEWKRVHQGEETYIYDESKSLFDRFFGDDLPNRHTKRGLSARPRSTGELDSWWVSFARDNLSHLVGIERESDVHGPSDSPYLTAMLEMDLVHFDEELNAKQQNHAMEKLRLLMRKHSQDIRAHVWAGVPIVFTMEESYVPPLLSLAQEDLIAKLGERGAHDPLVRSLSQDDEEDDEDMPCWMLPFDFTYEHAIAYFQRYSGKLVKKVPGLMDNQVSRMDTDSYRDSNLRGLRFMQRDKEGIFNPIFFEGSEEDLRRQSVDLSESLSVTPREHLRRALQKQKAKR